MTPKPVGRTNLLHQQLLSGLIETKPTSWSFKEIDPSTDEVVKTKVTGVGLANPLAGNVSALNVDRAARRWIR